MCLAHCNGVGWMAEAVSSSAHSPRPPHHTRACFQLVPEAGLALQGSGLPALKQERLNAPAILLLHKVASYAASKLAEAGIHVLPAPVYYSAARQAEQVSSDLV